MKPTDRNTFVDYLMNIEIPDDTAKLDEGQIIYDILKAGMDITPENLYRYRVCNDYAFDALENDKFLLTKPTMFNDPFDALLYIDKNKLQRELKESLDDKDRVDPVKKMQEDPNFKEEQIKLLGVDFVDKFSNIKPFSSDGESKFFSNASILVYSKFIEDLTKLSMDSLKQSCLVGCVSEKINSILMWSHYADSHKGFALNYDFKSRYMVEAKINKKKVIASEFTDKKLFPVKYTNERFDATHYVEHNFIYNFFHNAGVEFNQPFFDKLFYYKYLLFKSTDWSYEKEWRVIKQTNLDIDDKKDFDFIEYIKPKEIFLGAFITEDHKQRILKIAKDKKIDVFQMHLQDKNRQFELNCEKVKI